MCNLCLSYVRGSGLDYFFEGSIVRGVKSSPIQFRDSKFPKVNHRNRGIKNRSGVNDVHGEVNTRKGTIH